MKHSFCLLLSLLMGSAAFATDRLYTVVGTGQSACFDNQNEIAPPHSGQPFYGQDAQHPGPAPSYRDNGNGTISDLNTGLMWVQARGAKVSWADAAAGAATCRVAGYSDWRMPTIKELYSLILFTGFNFRTAAESKPYLDTRFFGFAWGDESIGERLIDCQDWSATEYIRTTMNGDATVFGVNFADGRIKGYPKNRNRREGPTLNKLYVRYVRGNPGYGNNSFHANGDGTVTDRATGLMWQQADSGRGMNWEQALAYATSLNLAGHSDWRLPNAKELQSIMDYTRVPAMDPIFTVSRLSDGEYSWEWTSTTHLDGPPDRRASTAVYLAVGRALGWMPSSPSQAFRPRPMNDEEAAGVMGRRPAPEDGEYRLLDVHGAGAQRSDPKSGDPAAFPHGRGPQGDVIRIFNYVRCVRNDLAPSAR